MLNDSFFTADLPLFFSSNTQPMNTEKIYTVITFGSSCVGKSCLVKQFVFHRFIEDYDFSIEDSYRKVITVDGETRQLDVIDTVGQEEYSAMRDQEYRKGDGFILTYSITDRASFEDVTDFADGIIRVRAAEYVPIVLCGCKCDLEEERQVSTEEGQKLADERGWPFIETSAKDRTNVEEAFVMVTRAIMRDDISLMVNPDNEEDKKCVIQ